MSVSYEVVEAYFDRVKDAETRIVQDIVSGVKSQSWVPLQTFRLKKIWSDYAKIGMVRDERGLDSVADDFLDKIATFKANNEIAGHERIPSKAVFEEQEAEFTPEMDEMIADYLLTSKGVLRISDYGIDKLEQEVYSILSSKSAEEKLLALDRILNVIHQRSDLASWFVEGGRETLEEIGNESTL